MTQNLSVESLGKRQDQLYEDVKKIRPRSLRMLLVYLIEKDKRDIPCFVKSRRAKHDYNLAVKVIFDYFKLLDDSTEYILNKKAYDELERSQKQKENVR